jgi:hypothetical protein
MTLVGAAGPRDSSGELVDLNLLGLSQINETEFLTALAGALDSAVDHGLDIGRRIGWDGHSRLWQLGDLDRVYYLIPGRRTQSGIEDPDAYHHGIAPSVKLLFAAQRRHCRLAREACPNTSLEVCITRIESRHLSPCHRLRRNRKRGVVPGSVGQRL